MNLDDGKTEIQTAIKAAMLAKYGAEVKETDMVAGGRFGARIK